MGWLYIAYIYHTNEANVGKYAYIDGTGMGVLLASINFFQVTFWYS